MTGHNGPTRGRDRRDRPHRGVNAQAAIENITPDVPVPKVDQGNGNTGGSKLYSCPLPLDGRRLLVSARGPVLVRTFDGECQSVALSAPPDGMQYFSAPPVRPRVRPPVIPSRLPATPPNLSPPSTCRTSTTAGAGRRRGKVKTIRVVREMQKTVRIDPVPAGLRVSVPGHLLRGDLCRQGRARRGRVDPDGSAYFRVPAGVPLYFMALDATAGRCSGCGASRTSCPARCRAASAATSIAKGPRVPQLSTYGLVPAELQPPEWGPAASTTRGSSSRCWTSTVRECHNPLDAPRGIDLTGGKTDFFNVSYDVLARENQGRTGSPYVNWIPTYNGQEWNILEVRPKTWGSPQSRLAEIVCRAIRTKTASRGSSWTTGSGGESWPGSI